MIELEKILGIALEKKFICRYRSIGCDNLGLMIKRIDENERNVYYELQIGISSLSCMLCQGQYGNMIEWYGKIE